MFLIRPCIQCATAISGIVLSVGAHALPYTFQAISIPNGGITARGINNTGDTAGDYNDWQSGTKGFLESGGLPVLFSVPNALYTNVNGMNDSGQVVGEYFSNTTRGFVRTDATIVTLNAPSSFETRAFDINNNGSVVGFFANQSGYHGFIWNGSSYTTLDAPDARGTLAQATNDSGAVVGFFESRSRSTYIGFYYSNGSFMEINVPGSTRTTPRGLNNLGQIVGSYNTSEGERNFIYSAGKYTTFDIPGGNGSIFSINDFGQIVGVYGYGTESFIATPVPELSQYAMMLIGIGALFARVGKRHSARI